MVDQLCHYKYYYYWWSFNKQFLEIQYCGTNGTRKERATHLKMSSRQKTPLQQQISMDHVKLCANICPLSPIVPSSVIINLRQMIIIRRMVTFRKFFFF